VASIVTEKASSKEEKKGSGDLCSRDSESIRCVYNAEEVREQYEEETSRRAQSRELHVGDPGGWKMIDPRLGVNSAILFRKTIFRFMAGGALGFVTDNFGCLLLRESSSALN
jgi:hypothetical protein